jgi:hypothetical protein
MVKDQLQEKSKFLELLVKQKKEKNDALNKLVYEKNKQIIELNRKIEYLLQEQRYEIMEILHSLKNGEIDDEMLNQLMEKYNSADD